MVGDGEEGGVGVEIVAVAAELQGLIVDNCIEIVEAISKRRALADQKF
jgi:hypothetical protein